jgi:hypothetical protein
MNNLSYQIQCVEESLSYLNYFGSTFKFFPSEQRMSHVNYQAFISELEKEGSLFKTLCVKTHPVSKFSIEDGEDYSEPAINVKAYIDEENHIIVVVREGAAAAQAKNRHKVQLENVKVASVMVFYSQGRLERALRFLEECKEFNLFDIEYETKNNIHFLCFDDCFYLKQVKVPTRREIDLAANYGANFTKIHETLMTFLSSDKVGLALLHGEPGTGKTSYIRHLLSILKKKVVYIPPHLVNQAAEPQFLTFLLQQSNLILVIEDAEQIVTSREDTHNSSGVSNLLNLTDGILGDCIKVQVICTFNQGIGNIDKALLRKGRLALEHQFKKLSKEDANNLFVKLGKEPVAKEEMSLGDVYNFDYENFRQEKEKPVVGFGAR